MKNRILLSLVTIFSFLLLGSGVALAASYQVEPGDSVWMIGQRYGVSADQIKWVNGLLGTDIYPGQTLTIPDGGPDVERYTVKPGDTLGQIAHNWWLPLDSIRRANNIWTDEIYPGQVLVMPVRKSGAGTPSRGGASRQEFELLARLVTAEAEGEPYEGQVAVAAVVLNRIKSGRFPSSIPGVIYDQDQFESVGNGRIDLPPAEAARNAARDALNGWDPSYGALFFYNPSKAQSDFLGSKPVTRWIGSHVFLA